MSSGVFVRMIVPETSSGSWRSPCIEDMKGSATWLGDGQRPRMSCALRKGDGCAMMGDGMIVDALSTKA